MEVANEVRVVYDEDEADGVEQFLASDPENPMTGWELKNGVLVVDSLRTTDLFSMQYIRKVVIHK